MKLKMFMFLKSYLLLLGGVLMSEENIHLDCENYNAKMDMCLKWFEEGVSKYKECAEKRRFSDTELQRKWSN